MQSTDLHNPESAATNPQPVSASFPDPQPPASGPEDEISLLDLLLVLAKRWRMIVGVTLAAGVITALVTLTMPNMYTARAMILPSQDDKGMMSAMMAQLGGLAGLAGGIGGPTTSDLYVTMLKSETVKDPIIDRFKLMDVYEVKYRADAYGALDSSAAMSLGKKDGVITIAVTDRDPKRAADVANAYVEELGRLTARLSMGGAGKNRVFFEERLATAQADLARAEDALKVFQSRNKAVAVTEQAKATIEGVAQLRAQLAAKEVELAALRQSMTDESHEVKNLKALIGNLGGQIARLESGSGGGAVPGLGAVPQIGQEYVRLMREFKIQETLVELLTKQYEMTKLSEAKDVSPFQVLQKAKVPERKSGPSRRKKVVTVMLISLFASIALSFIVDSISRMDDKVKERWKKLMVNM